MSTEIQEKEVVKIKQSESLISKRRRKILVDPLDDNNPNSHWYIISYHGCY